MRVEITFSALLTDWGVKIEIHPTGESASKMVMLYEFFKKKRYETVLIPLWQRKYRTHPKN